MSNSYKDVELKLEYYKEEVLKDLIKKGIYPDNATIESRVKSINSHLALFENYRVSTGKLFNANEYNQRLKLIYKDLEFLYKILYELTVIEYNKLQNFINSHISELDLIVETYNKRAEFENSSTTLGRTLLFKNNSFSIENKNSTTTVNLGEINIQNAATLACIANINNIKAEDIVFKFRDVDSEEWIVTSAYNYNNDLVIMPGEIKKTKYEYKLQEGQRVNGPLFVDINSDINIKNKYLILGGKNKIFVNYKDDAGFTVEEKPLTIDSLEFSKKAYINFFIVDGNSITFRFNKKPISANFPVDTQRVDNLKYIHHFFIECDDNFSFQFELDKGEVYAIKETGVISNNKLYYTGSDKINDFLIIESSSGDESKYEVKLEAYNSNDDIDIDSIIIKQIE